MKLIGDIGGTKVLLACVDDHGVISQCRRLASADFSCFDDLLAEYLRACTAAFDGGCLAVAGPVSADGRAAKITNLPWCIDADALAQRFGLGCLHLINDFAGVAMGVAALPKERRVTLQVGQPGGASVCDDCRLVIGAGTGLGVAALLGAGDGLRVLASEGGHVGFAPQNALENGLHAVLLAGHGRVTAERVISGPGLTAIHRILTGDVLAPAEITCRALAGDAQALATTDAFFAAYGAFAGDMAMAFMARGGVYLAGGVTQHLLPLIATSPFLTAFNAKAEHAALLACMPVHVVTDGEIGLAGAAVAAAMAAKAALL